MTFSLLNRKRVFARKAHRCIWCDNQIRPGSKYVREASVYDGDFQTLGYHEACLKESENYFDEVGEGEFPGGCEMPFFALYQLDGISA